MINLAAWLLELAEFMMRIPTHPFLLNMHFSLTKRISRDHALLSIGELHRADSALLDPLLEFYGAVARDCKIEYRIDPPDGFAFAGHEANQTPSVICGGFHLLNCDEILEKKHNCDVRVKVLEQMIRSAPPEYGATLELFEVQRSIMSNCIPFWEIMHSDSVALVPERAGVEPGVYYVAATESYRLCANFWEWLDFLRKSCYVGPSWDMLKFWHQGNQLVPRPAIVAQLAGFLGQSDK